ncbi:MAG: CARDB domain-containing protein [Anaerolineae bacterium]
MQDTLARFFPTATDSDGLVNSISTPELNPLVWKQHAASDIAWWHVYLTQDAGNTELRDLTAQAGSGLLLRFDRDSDRDGYPDRIESQYGTDPLDPTSHPIPAMLAGYTTSRQGNTVTVKLALQNNGTFDAIGVHAVMYSPDNTTTIQDNTIGGNGQLAPGQHIAVSSFVKKPVLVTWNNSTAKVYSGGNFSGNQDKIYTFKVTTPGVVGQGSAALSWDDGAGNTGSLDLGVSYHAPLPLNIGSEGVQINLDTGTLYSGETFTVSAFTARDTFNYVVNTDPYTAPVIVVTYSDPQGSHKFVTPIQLNSLSDDLTPYTGQMLNNIEVQIAAQAQLNQAGNNTTAFVFENPHPQAIQNANLYVDFVGNGTVVAHLPYTLTLQSGPTVFPVTWTTSAFTQTYNATIDYLMIATWTDQYGNIIDTHARPFSTFAADPKPILNTSPASWNIGTVVQGAQPQQDISIVNTGLLPMNVVVTTQYTNTLTLKNTDGTLATGILSVPPAGTRDVIATLDTTNLSGAVNLSLTIRSNDPANQTATVPINGTVTGATGAANAFSITNRPLDNLVRVYANNGTTITQGSTITFAQVVSPTDATIEPCKIYDSTGQTLKGVGKYCSDFGIGTVSYQIFGDGADGPLTVTANPTIINSYAAITGISSSTVLQVSSTAGFTPTHEILIHQTQGTNAGIYEFATIASVGSGTITLTKPISNTYSAGGNSHAQIVGIPHYTDVTVQSGGVLTAQSWNGTTGGIIAFRASGTTTVTGSISAAGNTAVLPSVGAGIGFSGGPGRGSGDPAYAGEGTNGTPIIQTWANSNGGGGGDGGPIPGGASGGGGGHATAGSDGNAYANGIGGAGGLTAGSADLTVMVFGGGGGGSSPDNATGGAQAGGGGGGGIVFFASRIVNVTGGINVNGGNADTNTVNTPAGGGAGGSFMIKGQVVSLGSSFVTALGGIGGYNSGHTLHGGDGSVGRIRVEYCDHPPTGSSNPAANVAKISCYIAEKTDPATLRFTVPDTIPSPGQNYIMQFGRRYSFGISGGTVMTPTQIIAQSYLTATIDALVTNVGAGGVTNLNVQLGNQSIYSTTQTITLPTTINIPTFATALNSYLTGQTIGSVVSVPIRVTANNQADVILTNLALTPGSGVDLAVGPSDLTLGCPGGPSCLATEGNTIPVNLIVHNNGNQPAASAVIGYYAGDPSNGGKLLGNSYVAAIQPGGQITATFGWNTTGYTHTQTIYTFVDPSNSIAETVETNNVVSQTLNIKTKPNLQVAGIAVDHTDRIAGEPISVTTTISNTGETDASTNTQRINESGERGDTLNQDMQTGGIGASSAITFSAVLTPTLFGLHTITLTTDATNAVTESTKSDNVLTRTFYIGLNPPDIDAGGGNDTAYSTANGYGYLNGSTYDFSGAGVVTKTVRYDGNGDIQYRIDGLQPTRAYHLDGIFYQEGDNFTETVRFSGVNSGVVIPMNDSSASTTSILVPPTAYPTGTLWIDIVRPNGAFMPSRFSAAASSTGPAFVSELHLTPIQYAYIDAGGTNDLPYDPTRGAGYYGTNTYPSTLGGSDAVSTYRSAFSNTVTYEFSGLDPNKAYFVDLTLYDGPGSTRVETVLSGNTPITGCQSIPVNSVQRVQCLIPPSNYATQGIAFISVQCNGCTSPRVNEIALEQKTVNVIGSVPTPTPTPTITLTPTPTATATPSIQTIISSFAAQWSGSAVRITWGTTSENKIDTFTISRSTSITGTWQTVLPQPSLSSCAAQTFPVAYSVLDSSALIGQTYYYKLTWSGNGCIGGVSGTYPVSAVAAPVTDTPTSTPTLTNTPITPTPTVTNSPTATSTPVTPTPTPTNTPTVTNTPITPTNTPTITAVPITLFENEDPAIQYDNWRGVRDNNASGGTYRVSRVANDKATFKFSGTSITWVTRIGPAQGIAKILIDSVSKGTPDLYSPTDQWQVAKTYSGLANAAHTLVIQVTGTKNASATDTNVVIDAFKAGAGTTQDNTITVQYNNWIGASNASASGGAYRSNKTAGTIARFTFTGSSIDWITTKGTSYGKANVYIDGVNKGTYDLYKSSSAQWQYVVTFPNLGAGQHTIEVRPLGTKNASSTAATVIVDAFRGAVTAVPNQKPTLIEDGGVSLWLLVLFPLGWLGLWAVRRQR